MLTETNQFNSPFLTLSDKLAKRNLLTPLEQGRLWRTLYAYYLKTTKWHQIKVQVIARAQGRCECCKLVPGVFVHHETYLAIATGNTDSLKFLCWNCHKLQHLNLRAASTCLNWDIPEVWHALEQAYLLAPPEKKAQTLWLHRQKTYEEFFDDDFFDEDEKGDDAFHDTADENEEDDQKASIIFDERKRRAVRQDHDLDI